MKKTTRTASAPLRLARETLRHLSGGDFDPGDFDVDTGDFIVVPLPRPSRPSSISTGLGNNPLSFTCPPNPPTSQLGGG